MEDIHGHLRNEYFVLVKHIHFLFLTTVVLLIDQSGKSLMDDKDKMSLKIANG
jgi:hypothetical protein